MRLFRRGTRGAGALEYALLMFLILVAGFVAWKYLGGSVSGSTKSASDKFQSGESAGGGAAAGGAGGAGAQGAQAQGGKGAAGGTKAGDQGGGTTGGNSKTGVAGNAKVATVEQGGVRNADNSGPGGRAAGDPEAEPKRRNWIKAVIIIVVVLGMMATLYSFGKKRAST